MTLERNLFTQAMGYPSPTSNEPSVDDLQEMMTDGGCEATDGCWTEADGRCEHGHASWLMYLGFI